MVRICPNCKKNLGSFDHYFCTSCGLLLPADVQQPDAKSVRIADFARESKKLHEINPTLKAITQNIPEFLNRKMFLIVGSTLLIMFVFIGVFARIKTVLTTRPNKNTATVVSKNIKPPVMSDLFSAPELNLNLTKGDFSKSLYPQYLPFNVEIMIEGFDLDSFGKFFGSRYAPFEPLTTLLNQKTDGHFVLFATKPVVSQKELEAKASQKTEDTTKQEALIWSILFYPKDNTFNVPKEIIDANPDLVFVKSDPIFLITSQKVIADQVIDAKGKVAKSLAKTPTYIKVATFLGGDNQLFIISKGEVGAEFFTKYYEEIKDTPEVEIIVKSILESPDREYFLYK